MALVRNCARILQTWSTFMRDKLFPFFSGGTSRLKLAPLLLVTIVTAAIIFSTGCVSPRGSNSELPLGGPEYSALVASSDLAKGRNRLIFALVDRRNVPVDAGQARIVATYTPPGSTEAEVRQEVNSDFLPWPPEGSGRGVFVADIEFDVAGEATPQNPGLWELRISATRADGTEVETTTAVRVFSEPSTPVEGDPAPLSITPTANEAEDLTHITSALEPDPDLYQLSVHEALGEEKPLVVLFSTPAFCVSATCGPQLEILGQLKDRYTGRANFIHVEVFKDPHLIQGNRTAAQQVPAVEEWGLLAEPWTFVVDRNGKVSSKFEQFTPLKVLEAALQEVL